ncbi:ABC transporter permease [Bradyrhizobium sp. RDM4]|uniref:ABC transporter permease n=1 Tax=Bradyrhizobium sp. RDM4 TaxID=3378765 RepID=UPI0038FCE768
MSSNSATMWLKPFIARPIALAGLGVLLATVLAAAFAPWLSPYDPYAIDPMIRLTPPNAIHWFGTDQFGRDTLSRTIQSARMALLIGSGVVVFALATGVPAGVLSALFPRLGHLLMRMVDVLMAFPTLLLALGLIVILGPSVANVILAIGLGYMTTTTRIVYGLTLRLRAETYVEASRSMGAGTAWLISRHILPNLVSPLLVQASFVFAFAQLGAASLDFLGLGAPPGDSELGQYAGGIAYLHHPRPVAALLPGHDDRGDGIFPEPGRRRIARSSRSAVPSSLW